MNRRPSRRGRPDACASPSACISAGRPSARCRLNVAPVRRSGPPTSRVAELGPMMSREASCHGARNDVFSARSASTVLLWEFRELRHLRAPRRHDRGNNMGCGRVGAGREMRDATTRFAGIFRKCPKAGYLFLPSLPEVGLGLLASHENCRAQQLAVRSRSHPAKRSAAGFREAGAPIPTPSRAWCVYLRPRNSRVYGIARRSSARADRMDVVSGTSSQTALKYGPVNRANEDVRIAVTKFEAFAP